TAEAADVVARLLQRRTERHAIAEFLARQRAPLAVVCGRGSSGHVGVFLRYLVETRLGIPVSATAPSIVTSFGRNLAMNRALFIVISQSGRSPDLVAATRAARNSGALTLAVVNASGSPVEEAAEFTVHIEAGPERSVAATKSVIASMAALADLIAQVTADRGLTAALERLPDRLGRALGLDWNALATALPEARAVYVAARGFGLAPTREIALKMAETLRLPALAFSAAELMHGPRAAIGADTPVLTLRLADETAGSVDSLVEALRHAGHMVFRCGGDVSELPWIGDDHAVTDAIAMLVPAYRVIEATARRLGLDPDRPPNLSKVTETL
ncbi:MAG TPA: SIS domain-containing protein, partial [Stellaceae bacterium]|nr:SIS domain-containing protein [Stellaceae bacterium]